VNCCIAGALRSHELPKPGMNVDSRRVQSVLSSVNRQECSCTMSFTLRAVNRRSKLNASCRLTDTRSTHVVTAVLLSVESDAAAAAAADTVRRHDARDALLSSMCCRRTDSKCHWRHRRRLHGSDGGDRPHGQKLVGNAA